MPLEQFVLAHASDNWLRHILEGNAVRVSAPRLKAKYLTDKLEVVANRPWKAEISGRLLSLALDIAEFAERKSSDRPGLRFRHVAFVEVISVRQVREWDVYSEPKPDDQAHANLVAYKIEMAPVLNPHATQKISHEFVKSIVERIQVCDAENLEPLTKLRIQPPDG